MTGLDVLLSVLDAGGRIVPDPERPRLLAPSALRPLVDASRDGLRVRVEPYDAPSGGVKASEVPGKAVEDAVTTMKDEGRITLKSLRDHLKRAVHVQRPRSSLATCLSRRTPGLGANR